MPNGEPKLLDELVPPGKRGELTPPRVLEERMGWMWGIIIAVVVVLVVGFVALIATVGTLVWNAHMWGRDTYQTLIKELDENNDKIDTMTKELNDLKQSAEVNCKLNPKGQ